MILQDQKRRRGRLRERIVIHVDIGRNKTRNQHLLG
jgi:hypothetical protein